MYIYVCAFVQSDPAAAETSLEGIYILYVQLLEFLAGYCRRSVTYKFEEKMHTSERNTSFRYQTSSERERERDSGI